MKIIIDARILFWTGIGRYAKELLNQLQKVDSINHYVVLMRPQDTDKWRPTAANFEVEWVNADPYTLKEQLILPWRLYRLKPDLVHFLNPSVPVLYFGRHITTIHDLTLIDYKNVRGNAQMYQIKQLIFRFVIWMAAKFSRVVITDTRFVANRIKKDYRRKPGAVVPIHLGVSKLTVRPPKSAATPNPYLLYVGNFYPYKNIKRLIDMMTQLKFSHPKLQLILVGQDDNFAKELQIYAAHMNVSEQVEFTGFVSDKELDRYYQTANAYVFPSLSEGFGLPPLEAMRYGVPVMAANASCLPEVLGDAAVYFNPHNAEKMAQTISETLSNPAELKRLSAAGPQHLKNFSWESTAKQTLAVYQNAVK